MMTGINATDTHVSFALIVNIHAMATTTSTTVRTTSSS
jgi:hypothetical protein